MPNEFQELIDLYNKDPDALLQVFVDNPALRDQVLKLEATFSAGEEVVWKASR